MKINGNTRVGAPYNLTAGEIADALGRGHTAASVTARINAHFERLRAQGVVVGWLRGSDGQARCDFKAVSHALGMQHAVWVQRLDVWRLSRDVPAG